MPIHNYAEGVVRLLKFVENNYEALFGRDNFKVILINSHSDKRTCQILETFKSFPWVSLYHSNIKGSLKDALWTGWAHRDKTFKPDVVQIMETDALPNVKTLKAMLHLYFEEENKQVGSVTPMYKWNNNFCYPTHSHWHTDPLYKRHSNLGNISNVGGPGVPFLYSLWRPSLLEYINKNSFKTLIHLDRDFGNHIHGLGYKHLRLQKYSVDHFGGGRKSRR
jgi:hypothetical protein